MVCLQPLVWWSERDHSRQVAGNKFNLAPKVAVVAPFVKSWPIANGPFPRPFTNNVLDITQPISRTILPILCRFCAVKLDNYDVV